MKEIKYICGCGCKSLFNHEKAVEHSQETGHIINGSLTVNTPYLPQKLNFIIKERKRSNTELLIERSNN